MSDVEDSPQPVVPEEGAGHMEQRQVTIPFPDTFVYSNCSALSVSLMDIHIGFGEVLANISNVVPKVGVVIPPEHAAQLMLNLMQQLLAFERHFGPIRHPEWIAFKNAANGALRNPKSEPAQEP